MILDKITEETIKKDINNFMSPFTSRILVYGFILCTAILFLAGYINSNPLYKSIALFWLPIEAYLFWILFLAISFISEKIYKNIIKEQKEDSIKLGTENTVLRREIMKITGKKVVVKIGGEPPKKDPNEIVGDETIVHVPDSEIGKYQNITGLSSRVIIGGENKKD